MELYKNIVNNLIAVSSLIFVALLWENQLAVLASLSIIAVLLLFLRAKKRDLVFFVFTGFSGAAAEAIGVYFGAWTYTNSMFLGLPVWLPILWGVAGLYINITYDTVNEIAENYSDMRYLSR